jgi:hypothetical protein
MEPIKSSVLCSASCRAAERTRDFRDSRGWSTSRLMREVGWTGKPSQFYKLLDLGQTATPYTHWPLPFVDFIAQGLNMTIDQLTGATKCDFLQEATARPSTWIPSKQRPSRLVNIVREASGRSFVAFVPQGIPMHLLASSIPGISRRIVEARYAASTRAARRNLAKYAQTRQEDFENPMVPYHQTEFLILESQILALATSEYFSRDERDEMLRYVCDEVIDSRELTLRPVYDEKMSVDQRRALVGLGACAVQEQEVVIRNPGKSDAVFWSTSKCHLDNAQKQLAEIRPWTDAKASRSGILKQFDRYRRIASGTLQYH